MSKKVFVHVQKSEDRGRIRGWLDAAPRLGNVPDGSTPISDFWREVILHMLDVLDHLTFDGVSEGASIREDEEPGSPRAFDTPREGGGDAPPVPSEQSPESPRLKGERGAE